MQQRRRDEAPTVSKTRYRFRHLAAVGIAVAAAGAIGGVIPDRNRASAVELGVRAMTIRRPDSAPSTSL
jgi:hypothetical protein